MNRREFVRATFIGGAALSAMRAEATPKVETENAGEASAPTLFPVDLAELQWQEFSAAGFVV